MYDLRQTRLKIIANHLPKNRDMILADIGCGEGFWVNKLSPFFKEVVGIEPDNLVFDILRKNTLDKENITY